uniref:Uncharacterized protein n=1 Tax=Pithovirus LCPAC304 TaxID=2506594 RepID=A0A481ZAE2_9VIRU|nr:MAG: hypothetical protein LCPAC304_04060 [Pithovirus LCPAC304]
MHASRLGDYDNIVLSMLGSPFRTVLGAGGFGTVITTDDYPDLALKISHDMDVCPEWTQEYDVKNMIYENYDSRGRTVRVVRPLQFAYIEGRRCYILMRRVCSPENSTVAMHALLGEIDYDQTHGKRGRFVGQQFLGRYLDLEAVAVDLGVFLGTVHFRLGLDGNDLEYILGKRCGVDEKDRINVIDFGMVRDFTIKGAQSSIDAMPYFPLHSTCEYYDCTVEQTDFNARISELFAESYISEAEQYGKGDEAAEILASVQ